MAQPFTLDKNRRQHTGHTANASLYALWIAALLATIMVSAASFPGYMSYDSVQELLQARTHVEGSQYPPFGSYVWRVFDWIAPGPTLMQFVQNALLECSFAWLINRVRLPFLVKLACIVGFTAAPPILGTMTVVWKDVAVGACYMAALALIVSLTPGDSRGRKFGVALVALFLIWCGMAYRFNAASGAVPLIVYAMWQLSEARRSNQLGMRAAIGIAVRSAVITVVLCAAVWVLNNYRFPSFERLERNTNTDIIMGYDLIGISVFSGDPIVPAASGGMVSPDYLKQIYDPRHVNITAANDKEQRVSSHIDHIAKRWISAIMHHPVAYLKHRASVFKEYIGLHKHDVFYPTAADISANDLGVTSTSTPFKQHFTQYLWNARLIFVSRAWIYYAVTFVFVVASLLTGARRYRAEILGASLSAYLYLLPMFIVTPAADLRYNFWSICGCFVAVIYSAASLLTNRRSQSRN